MAGLLEGAHSLLMAWGWQGEGYQNECHSSQLQWLCGVERQWCWGARCGGRGSELKATLETEEKAATLLL